MPRVGNVTMLPLGVNLASVSGKASRAALGNVLPVLVRHISTTFALQIADPLADEGQAGAESLERRDKGLRAAGEMGGVHLDAAHVQLALVERLVVEAAHLDLGQLGQLAGQVFDVDARAAVDIRGIFVGGEQDAHCCCTPLAG